MTETTTLGAYLRRERERQGLSLRTISEKTKVSVGLLEGLEADDISRWPGGIFRRAFVRSYAQCVGLDADDVVRRFEQQHQPSDPEPIAMAQAVANGAAAPHGAPSAGDPLSYLAAPWRTRLLGTAADLTVAAVLAFGSAAAGSRLLWPVLLIAAYYAAGILLTGTSPMVALLGESPAPAKMQPPPTAAEEPAPSPPEARPANERRHQPRRTNERLRQRRGVPARAQS